MGTTTTLKHESKNTRPFLNWIPLLTHKFTLLIGFTLLQSPYAPGKNPSTSPKFGLFNITFDLTKVN